MDNNRVAILLEDLSSQFKIFVEGLAIVQRQIFEVDQKVDGLEKKVDNLEGKVIGIERKVTMVLKEKSTD